MVRHTDTPQGLAYRDGSGLACVLADFGSAKMLHPLMLNAAATEHEPISKMWWPTLRPALWLSRGFCQLPGVRPASTISRLGRALAGQIQALRLTYRHESTATAACAAPSIPYVCTRPYRAPELFYGAECYRGEPDGTRAYARVREYLLPPIRPSIRPCVLLFVRACVRVDVRARSVHHSKPTVPPPLPPRAVWSLGCLLCDVLLRGSLQTERAAHSLGVDLGAPQLATPVWGARATLHTPTVRWSVRTPPHDSLPCTSRPIGVASSSSMPRVWTATRCT